MLSVEHWPRSGVYYLPEDAATQVSALSGEAACVCRREVSRATDLPLLWTEVGGFPVLSVALRASGCALHSFILSPHAVLRLRLARAMKVSASPNLLCAHTDATAQHNRCAYIALVRSRSKGNRKSRVRTVNR